MPRFRVGLKRQLEYIETFEVDATDAAAAEAICKSGVVSSIDEWHINDVCVGKAEVQEVPALLVDDDSVMQVSVLIILLSAASIIIDYQKAPVAWAIVFASLITVSGFAVVVWLLRWQRSKKKSMSK